jgi:tetratricopeptide (TPR) repeat protein
MNKILFLFFLIFMSPAMIWGQSHEQEECFAEAMILYRKNQFEASIPFFTCAMKGEKTSLTALNQMGMAYYKLGYKAKAILCFERVLRRDPFHPSALQNVKAFQERLDTALYQSPNFWLFDLYLYLILLFSTDFWANGSLVLVYLSFLLWSYGFIQRKSATMFRRWVLPAFILFLSVIFLLHAELCKQNRVNLKEVIVMKPDVGVRSSPDIQGEDIVLVPEGVKAEWVEKKEGWYRLRFKNGLMGWVPENVVESI